MRNHNSVEEAALLSKYEAGKAALLSKYEAGKAALLRNHNSVEEAALLRNHNSVEEVQFVMRRSGSGSVMTLASQGDHVLGWMDHKYQRYYCVVNHPPSHEQCQWKYHSYGSIIHMNNVID